MNLAAIYHRTDENYCYPLNSEDLLISIKTGYEVDRIVLYHGDPFSHGIAGSNQNWQGTPVEITEYTCLKYHKLWKVIIKPEFKRAKYYFELFSGDECISMMEDDFYDTEHMKATGASGQYFTFPWLNPSDIVTVPSWVKDTVWYQIFPERFRNGNKARNNEFVKPWKYERVGGHDWYGGDLEGIIEKLPYIKELGITGLYLNPIFLAGSNHKYETTDYETVDPGFGDNETLKELVDKAHSMGIAVMLDAVFNHCGYRNPIWIDVVEKGRDSEYFDWFFINKWPIDTSKWDTKDGSFYSFSFFGGMPKLNTNNVKVMDYLIGVCKNWINDYGIDGIRFDVGNEISHTFLKKLNRELKAVKPDIYLMGEIWHDSEEWLKGDEYDAVMNYPLVNSVTAFWLDDNFKKKDFEFALNRCYNLYRKQQMEVAFNLFDSHDTDRIMHRLNNNFDAVYQQMVVLFTMAGSPCIYYGTEIGMQGGFDPDCRRCMPWEDIEASKYEVRLNMMKHLISLRHQIKAFKSVEVEFVDDFDDDKILHYKKRDKDGHICNIILNCSRNDTQLVIDKHLLLANRYDGKTLMSNGAVIYEE